MRAQGTIVARLALILCRSGRSCSAVVAGVASLFGGHSCVVRAVSTCIAGRLSQGTRSTVVSWRADLSVLGGIAVGSLELSVTGAAPAGCALEVEIGLGASIAGPTGDASGALCRRARSRSVLSGRAICDCVGCAVGARRAARGGAPGAARAGWASRARARLRR